MKQTNKAAVGCKGWRGCTPTYSRWMIPGDTIFNYEYEGGSLIVGVFPHIQIFEFRRFFHTIFRTGEFLTLPSHA